MGKTRIIYCKDSKRKEQHPNVTFDFLGYTFKPRVVKSKYEYGYFSGFLPAIAEKSKKAISKEIRH